MPDLKEKKNRPIGRPMALNDVLVRCVTGVTMRRIAVGVIEENETSESHSIARTGKVPALFRRDAKCQRRLCCRSSTSIFFRKQPRLKMSRPRLKPVPRHILFM